MERELLLAYLAGIIDGEGSVGYYPSRPKIFVIAVEMTDQKTINLLHTTFGGTQTIRDRSDKPGRENHKKTYVWRVTCRSARNAYGMLEPYLRLKSDRLSN